MTDIEAIIWCPHCYTDVFELHRVKAANPGVFTYAPPVWLDENKLENVNMKTCVHCGGNLERKP